MYCHAHAIEACARSNRPAPIINDDDAYGTAVFADWRSEGVEAVDAYVDELVAMARRIG
jgi:hypothetical protein